MQPMAWPLKMSAPHWPSSVNRTVGTMRDCERENRTFKSQNGQLSIGGGAREHGTQFMWCPGHRVDWYLYQQKRNPYNKSDAPLAVWRVCSLTFAQTPAVGPCPCSFQISAFPSYEQDARMCPNLGCAQATCQTGPVCLQGHISSLKGCKAVTTHPLRVCPPVVLVVSPSTTSNTLIVRSEEHVARRFP